MNKKKDDVSLLGYTFIPAGLPPLLAALALNLNAFVSLYLSLSFLSHAPPPPAPAMIAICLVCLCVPPLSERRFVCIPPPPPLLLLLFCSAMAPLHTAFLLISATCLCSLCFWFFCFLSSPPLHSEVSHLFLFFLFISSPAFALTHTHTDPPRAA